jgi:hypothetical protein
MKIGWAKLTMPIEIDYNIASSGLGEERPMLFRNMLNRGHVVKILTPIKKLDVITLNGIKNGKRYEETVNSEWMKGLEYNPEGFADDCEVLVIENGPLNFTFIDHYTNQPQMRRAIDIINRFNGLVIFYQTDPLLPFPLWRFTMSERNWTHPNNNVRITGKGVEADGWADPGEIFNNKKILVLGKCPLPNPDFPYAMNGPRFRYDYFYDSKLVSFDFMPTGYDSFFIPHINTDFNKKIFPLVYMGFPRSRNNRFKSLYKNNMNKLNVWGPWNSKTRYKYLEKYKSMGMQWHGYLNGYIGITEAYSKAKISINLIPKRAMDLCWITSRLFESVWCNCICLGDELTKNIENYIPKDLIIDRYSCQNKIEEILNMSELQYTETLVKQYNLISHLNYDYIVTKFEELVQKYK